MDSNQDDDEYPRKRIRYGNNPIVKTYMEKLGNKHLMTTRFTNQTWEENRKYCKKMNKECIYATSEPVSQGIISNNIMMILEMNNDTNRIIGIGLLKNKPYYEQHSIHQDTQYNKFSYIGNMRISRESMTPDEERMMKVFDHLCFKGCDHQKRLKGIKSFPHNKLYNIYQEMNIDLVAFISQMFKSRMPKKI
jgi:hypothetical protein